MRRGIGNGTRGLHVSSGAVDSPCKHARAVFWQVPPQGEAGKAHGRYESATQQNGQAPMRGAGWPHHLCRQETQGARNRESAIARKWWGRARGWERKCGFIHRQETSTTSATASPVAFSASAMATFFLKSTEHAAPAVDAHNYCNEFVW